MKKAAMVSIGNEILSGRTVDTNTAYLGRELLSVGLPVVSVYTVGDDVDSIIRMLNLAGADADFILATGGLGPTDDDVTRQAFAEFLGVELQLRDELLEKIQDFFVRRGLEMPDRNRIQAHIPAGARSLPNNRGTAPGIMAEADGKVFAALPGVPSEMKQMFSESVLPQLERFAGHSGAFAADLLEKTGVVVTPGRGYGEHGEGYFRISLTYPDDVLEKAMGLLAERL